MISSHFWNFDVSKFQNLFLVGLNFPESEYVLYGQICALILWLIYVLGILGAEI